MVTKDISPDITTGLYPGWKKLGETSMVFGKKISTDVVNFLFYLPGKAVRRGYPRGEEGNVKGGDGVIALRPVKKRTDQRKRKKKNYRETVAARFIPEERDPENDPQRTRSPRSFTDNIRAKFLF